ncbi:MAG TPA: heparan N-sulfatase [Planctomycetes bacterium]|nr:heparan N-sulfatase [Planctomycetota bacterium]
MRYFQIAVLSVVILLFPDNWLAAAEPARPNILLAISDDQTWRHAGAYGDTVVSTPAFDRVAREGVLFNYGFCSTPSCSPSRAAILTGQDFWRLKSGANLFGALPNNHLVYPRLLEAAGYYVGHTGKARAWNQKLSGRAKHPAGDAWNQKRLKSAPAAGISRIDYAENFEAFLKSRPKGKPFCFWYGSIEPHRFYEAGSGVRSGKNLKDVIVPAFFPDVPQVRADILDYYVEIEWFDRHLARIIEMLEERGELNNTIIVVTSDHGMPFPRAKTNLYDYGVRVPLAIRWPAKVAGKRVVNDFVNLTDLAPTFLEAAGLDIPAAMTGRSLMKILTSTKQSRIELQGDRVFFGRERHGYNRVPHVGYPCRAIRNYKYLYIHNFKPDRLPGFDTDSGITKSHMLANRHDAAGKRNFHLWFGPRPAEELYDCLKDPDQIRNLADDPAYEETRRELAVALDAHLRKTGDPRVLGQGDEFDTYPYFGPDRSKKAYFQKLRKELQSDRTSP